MSLCFGQSIASALEQVIIMIIIIMIILQGRTLLYNV